MLALATLSASVVAIDEWRHPQHMWIMNIVWPTCALFGSLVWLLGYFRYGRAATHEHIAAKKGAHRDFTDKPKPFAVMVAEATSHCGSGCALGDICAEWLAFAVPAIAVWFGWGGLFHEKMFAIWALDFIFAYLFGIVFQYFTIAPMRGLNFSQGLWAAVKADTLSLMAWQLGMYGFMALAAFGYFRSHLGIELSAGSPEFWFTMQLAMLTGFVTSYPVNWWLLRIGIKEKM